MNIALIGYGKMGKEIETIVRERGHEIPLIIDISNPHDLTQENLKNIDVAIEFTVPTTAYNNYIQCFKAQVPVVSGTTGWLNQYDEIINECKTHSAGFFYASNFSLGVNIFFK